MINASKCCQCKFAKVKDYEYIARIKMKLSKIY